MLSEATTLGRLRMHRSWHNPVKPSIERIKFLNPASAKRWMEEWVPASARGVRVTPVFAFPVQGFYLTGFYI
jgi:hypothetical protein